MFTAKFEAESVALKKGATGKRGQLLNANSKLDKSTATLQQSRLLVDETEKIGSATLSDLENQREILVDASGKVKETRDHMQKRHVRYLREWHIVHSGIKYVCISG